MPNLAEVTVRIGARIESLQKGLQQAERELQRSGRAFTQLGSDLTRSLTLPIGAAGIAAIKFASDFEESFLKINTLVGIGGSTLDEYRAGIENLSGVLGKTQKELSDALFVITSAGQRGSEALKTLEAASKASAIGLGETTEIARAAVAAVQAYGEANLSSTEAVDKLTAIVRAGNLEASELAPALGKVLPIASQLGVSFDEVGANIATFTRLGVSTSESVTALKSLLSNILKPSEQAKEEFAKLGISAADLQKQIGEQGLAATLNNLLKAYDGNTEGLAKIFGGVEGLANVLGTAGAQGEVYLEIVNEIASSNGLVEDGFKKVSETANFKFKKALVELQNVSIQFGNTMLPIVTDLLRVVTPLISVFSKLPEPVKSASVVTGGLLASAGPLVSVFGNLKVVAGTAGIAFRSLKGGLDVAIDSFKSTRELIVATGGSLNALSGVLPAVTAAWKSFNTVVKLSIVGVVVTGIVALTVAVTNLTKGLSEAEAIQKSYSNIQKVALENTVKERLEAEKLTGILKSNTATYTEKQGALSRLNEIAPEYFSNLNIEKSSIDDITKSYNTYIESILNAAKAKASEEEIVRLEKERLAILDKIASINKQTNIVEATPGIFSFVRGIKSGFTSIAQLEKELTNIESVQKKLAESLSELQRSNKPVLTDKKIPEKPISDDRKRRRIKAPDLLPPTQEIADAVDVVVRAIEEKLTRELPQVSAVAGRTISPLTLLGEGFEVIENKAVVFGDSVDVLSEKIKLVETTISSLLEQGVNPYGNDITTLVELHKELSSQIDNTQQKVRDFNNAVTGIVESGVIESLGGIGNAIGSIFSGVTQQASTLALVLEPILGMLEQLGKLAIATGVAVLGIKTALKSLNPAAAISAGVALLALSKVVRAKLTDIKPKPFAEGGLVYGPTLALIGEGPGTTRSNPEVVAPLDRLQDMLLGAGSGVVKVEGVIRGRDIYISNSREETRRVRTTGRGRK